MALPIAVETVEVEVDLRLGGKFYTVMQSPEGQKFPNMGCYLEFVENTRLTWTNALEPSFCPVPELEASSGHECVEFLFTATIMLEPHGKGTKYTTIAQLEITQLRLGMSRWALKKVGMRAAISWWRW